MLTALPEVDDDTVRLISGTGTWRARQQLGEPVIDVYLTSADGTVSDGVTLWVREGSEPLQLYYHLGDPDNAPKIVLERSALGP